MRAHIEWGDRLSDSTVWREEGEEHMEISKKHTEG